MDKLSQLLKEAKPLYKSRKRRKTILTTSFCLFIPCLFFFNICQMYLEGENVYLSLNSADFASQYFDDVDALFEGK